MEAARYVTTPVGSLLDHLYLGTLLDRTAEGFRILFPPVRNIVLRTTRANTAGCNEFLGIRPNTFLDAN